MFFACLAIGIFYLVCYYGATVFFGPARMHGFINLGGGDPWLALATAVWGLGFIAVIIALVNSSIAGANASAAASAGMLACASRADRGVGGVDAYFVAS